MKKCCYMHFTSNKCTKLSLAKLNTTELQIIINGHKIKQVHETKFLGVIIDDKLSWKPHIAYLENKLKCCIGILKHVRDNVPKRFHKSLYHTLFESHLAYGISVWGGANNCDLEALYLLQKKCVRILFGDKEAYLEKFKTCVRTRPHDEQKLGHNFFVKEHTKPLFKGNHILTIYNLYAYQTLIVLYKVLKLKTPYPLYCSFNISKRKGTLIILSKFSFNFVCKASLLWNKIRNILSITDFSLSISSFKSQLKAFVEKTQNLGDQLHWSPENIFSIN